MTKRSLEIVSLPPPALEIVRDCSQWAEGFPDTDEVMQGILDEIKRRAANFREGSDFEVSDDEGDFDLPPGVGPNGATK